MSKYHASIPSRVWERLRRETLDRDGWRCRECGRAGALEVHHVIPLEEWPDQPWKIEGLLTLCRGCHIAIHRRAETEADKAWREFIDELASC